MKFLKTTYSVTALIFWGLSFFFQNEDWIYWTLIVGSVLSFGISEILYELRSLKTKQDEPRN